MNQHTDMVAAQLTLALYGSLSEPHLDLSTRDVFDAWMEFRELVSEQLDSESTLLEVTRA